MNIATSSSGIYQITALVQRERSNRAQVKWWLYVICLIVLAMVVVGGATRLTDSGLSITEWKPILGIIPPLSEAGWQQEFQKYKLIPEYSQINKGMSLAEFQFIYWWEWGHRFLGRMIGFVFVVPLAFFWGTGRLEHKLKPQLLLLLFLGGLQGFIGWWMVKSGLVERVDVSQYRLAVHLTFASVIFAYALWIARGLARHHTRFEPPAALRLFAPMIVLIVFLQIFLGGLVAGLDAGLYLNDWPTMGGKIVPDNLAVLQPFWRNGFENPITVQFLHRLNAYLLVVLIMVQWLMARKSRAEIPHQRRTVLIAMIALAQVAVGVATLRLLVPLPLALVHQALAFILLGIAIAHWRGLRGEYAPVTAIELRS